MKEVILGFFCTSLFLISCGQDRNVEFFKDTKAYDLAKAVGQDDIERIEYLVKRDSSLLQITNKHTGSNALDLALTIENFRSFKKLLDLGSNPNFINPLTKRSILINACKYYWKPESYTIDLRYIKLLLVEGSDPNYVVDTDFTDYKGHHQSATSALHEAASIDLSMVKLLIHYGADPLRKIISTNGSSFGEAFSTSKLDIIYYYLDSIKVDVHEPMNKWGEEDYLYIQDYIKIFMGYKEGSPSDIRKKKLIKRLESMGVDFKNHDYK